MSDVTGIQRLRQAIDNQSAAGEACFSLPAGEARAICDECEDELAQVAWAKDVTAPVDADGEVVPLDTEVLYREDGGKCKVAYWAYYPDEKDGWTAVSDVMGTKKACIPKTLHLTRPDSWELLEEDVARCDDKLTSCAYYKRVPGECDGCPSNGPEYCDSEIMRDILRRAKALAGRGED